MQCTEGSSIGDLTTFDFSIPDQEECDRGNAPYFCVSVSELLSAYHDNLCNLFEGSQDEIDSGKFAFHPTSAHILTIDAEAALLNEVADAEDADIVAGWLEHWATIARSKFRETDERGGLAMRIEISPGGLYQYEGAQQVWRGDSPDVMQVARFAGHEMTAITDERGGFMLLYMGHMATGFENMDQAKAAAPTFARAVLAKLAAMIVGE